VVDLAAKNAGNGNRLASDWAVS